MGQINADIRTANSLVLEKYRKKEKDVMGRSTEGGSMIEYRDGDQLRYVEIWKYGEMGKVEYKVFPIDIRYRVIVTEYHYPEQFDVEHATVVSFAYYYSDKSTYELQEGALKKTKRPSMILVKFLRSCNQSRTGE